MKTLQFYLAGGMEKFGKDDFVESNSWRIYCEKSIKNYDSKFNVEVINPNNYFNFGQESLAYETEKEIMDFDLRKVRKSDLLIVNFNDIYSLGTMAEIATAYENRIPIIGLNANKQKLHSWQIGMSDRIFIDIDKMLSYVKEFYLN